QAIRHLPAPHFSKASVVNRLLDLKRKYEWMLFGFALATPALMLVFSGRSNEYVRLLGALLMLVAGGIPVSIIASHLLKNIMAVRSQSPVLPRTEPTNKLLPESQSDFSSSVTEETTRTLELFEKEKS